jgi:hypothetical protein
MYFNGYQLIEAKYMADKVQARTHKKKRINKKWLKRYGMKEVPWKKCYIVGDKIYAHPMFIQKLINEVAIRD